MEIEVKYSLPETEFSVLEEDELIRAHSRSWQRRNMSSEYYDNDLGQLGARDYVLRFRHEGGQTVCCVKYANANGPDGLKSREELEFPAANIGDGVARLLSQDIPEDFKAAIRRPLSVIARLRFVRKSCMVSFEDFSCEMAMDEGVFGSSTPFRELEFELKSGSAESMLAFSRGIMAKYRLIPQYESKLSRALKA